MKTVCSPRTNRHLDTSSRMQWLKPVHHAGTLCDHARSKRQARIASEDKPSTLAQNIWENLLSLPNDPTSWDTDGGQFRAVGLAQIMFLVHHASGRHRSRTYVTVFFTDLLGTVFDIRGPGDAGPTLRISTILVQHAAAIFCRSLVLVSTQWFLDLKRMQNHPCLNSFSGSSP